MLQRLSPLADDRKDEPFDLLNQRLPAHRFRAMTPIRPPPPSSPSTLDLIADEDPRVDSECLVPFLVAHGDLETNKNTDSSCSSGFCRCCEAEQLSPQPLGDLGSGSSRCSNSVTASGAVHYGSRWFAETGVLTSHPRGVLAGLPRTLQLALRGQWGERLNDGSTRLCAAELQRARHHKGPRLDDTLSLGINHV
ncbi:unnamed protein product [Gadus morhua 'NCC']